MLLTATLLLGVSVIPSAASVKEDSIPAWAVDGDTLILRDYLGRDIKYIRK